jgi:hypothetical protein
LYSFVHDTQDAQRAVDVGVVVRMPPESANRLLTSQSASKVRITLRGSRTTLDDLHVDDVGSIQIDARDGNEKSITLDPQMVHLPPGVRVEQFDPPGIDLEWEDQIVRDVQVEASVVGTPASGYIVKGSPAADPPSIRVRGAKSEVVTLQHVRAEAFDARGLTEGTYARDLAIDRQSGLKYETSEVKVTAVITRELVERAFTKLPVVVLGPTKAKALPAEVDVRLTCPPEIAHALRPEQVVPRVDVKQKDATGAVALPVDASVGQCQASVTPPTVIVRW